MIEALIGLAAAAVVGLLVNLATPTVKGWIDARRQLKAGAGGVGVAGGGTTHLVSRTVLADGGKLAREVSGALVVGGLGGRDPVEAARRDGGGLGAREDGCRATHGIVPLSELRFAE